MRSNPSSFLHFYFGSITNPSATFESIVHDERKISLASRAVLITAVLYTLVYVFLILGGGQPFRPWLNIPLEEYYSYNVFFCALTMFLGLILAAGVVHTLSRLITTTGNFEDILSLFGFGISVASWTTGIHDILTSFLGGMKVISQHDYEIALNSPTIWRTLLWIQMAAYIVCFVIQFYKATKTIYQVKPGSSILLAVSGFLVYQLFFFVFNR